jgi:hypothetical protein
VKVSRWAACALLLIAVLAGAGVSARPHKSADNEFGGPVYAGPPDLVTAGAFVSAGGGATAFSTRVALHAIIGPQLVDPEIATLQKQYGTVAVASWLQTSDFAIRNAVAQATAAGVDFPLASPTHTGKALFTEMMHDGMDSGSTFWTGTMLDKLFTHPIHVQTMRDIDASLGADADANYHKITNQFVYDVAVQLGLGDTVKLAPDH